MITLTKLSEICKLVRKDVLESTYEAKSGHPTTCLSSVELMVVLFFKHLVFEPENYPQLNHDEFILSKGHAAPLLYSIYKKTGIINEDLMSLRKFGSLLEGHPSVKLRGVKYATGSLGQGLSIAVGAAWARKYYKIPSKVYVLAGDGEFLEGSNFEALNIAKKYNLNNLCLILDVNRLGQSEETLFKHKLDEYYSRIVSFGWDCVIVDGHNIEEIDLAYQRFTQGSDKPFAIVAKTFKGKGVSFLEDKENWHGKPIQSKELLDRAIEELDIKNEELSIQVTYKNYHFSNNVSSFEGNLDIDIEDKPMATRQAISVALTKIGKSVKNLIVLDADVKNSTYTELFEKEYTERFIQCHIAEQVMTGMALGIAKNGFIVYLSTFGAFFTRAFDFIRMMMYSKPPLVIFTGTHAGVSIGEDGPSQMALEDLSMFTSLIESTVLYPADSISAQKLLLKVFEDYFAGKLRGIVYFRTSRPSTPNIYGLDNSFEIGKVGVIRKSENDRVAVFSNGVPLFEVLKAYDLLKQDGIDIRVIDVYTIKPIDEMYLKEALQGISKILVFEEHSTYGGIGQILASILLKINHSVDYFNVFGVDKIPLSAPSQELLSYHNLDYISIYKKVKEIL
ncbi:MAG: transketolase [Candidatus Calescibacterium sp.]|nr:transketolase [Candidatus Calescibacterium sp.]MDW8132476.1 transketolase [Candidatus Calescibacterium sp.]